MDTERFHGTPAVNGGGDDMLLGMARLLARRTQRRDILGAASRGAVLLAAALAGVAPFGGGVRRVLASCSSAACCYGCLGACTCGANYSVCDHTYTYYLPNSSGQLGQSYASCRVNCGATPFQCCFAYVANQNYVYGCPCQALDCTGGCGSGGPC